MANEYEGNLKGNYEQNTSTNFNNNESCNNERSSSKKEIHNGPTNLLEYDGVSASSTNYGNTVNDISHPNEHKQMTSQPQRREENPFSFKHFLNRDTNNCSNTTSISATIVSSNNTTQNSYLNTGSVTSYSPHSKNYSSVFSLSPNNSNNVASGSSISSYSCCNHANNNGSNNNSNINEGESFSSIDQNAITTSEVSNSGTRSNSSNPYQSSTGARPKVPQSISTSSSIGSGSNIVLQPFISILTSSMSSLAGGNENSKMKRSPRFSSFDSQASLAECAAGSNDRNDSTIYNSGSGGFIRACPEVSNDSNENSGELFITNSEYDRQFIPRSYSNYDMDVTPSTSSKCPTSSTSGRNNEVNCSTLRNRNPPAVRPNRLVGICSQLSNSKNQEYSSSNVSTAGGIRPNSEFTAAALPDFVQDHWMDQWYYNEMHLNSPTNSPNQSPIDFVEDLPSCMMASAEKCQTLPDFLSDGPIIHSSGRLADVAAGLPNLDSPEDDSLDSQLSRMRLENDRLRRELDESRITLAEQIRRSNDLERRLEQSKNNELLLNKNLNQNMEQADENSEQIKKRFSATQGQIENLKLQIRQLMAEVNELRKENELIRETGSAQGVPINNRKPSKNKNLSKELIRAAANAECNLRQLLSGVDNLRLMARSLGCDNSFGDNNDEIEFSRQNSSQISDTVDVKSTSINLVNENYLSDCDDVDDFDPAL